MPGDELIGKRLRTRRAERGLTLRDLAAQTSLTPSFLSLVERGQTSPSIDSLRRIAEALGVPVLYFLAEDVTDEPVVRGDARRRLQLPESHLTYELLVPDLNRKMLVWISRLDAGTVSAEAPLSHPAEEFLLVLEGRLDVELGDRRFHLAAGDSIYWDGNTPHRFACPPDADAVFLSAITPPVLLR